MGNKAQNDKHMQTLSVALSDVAQAHTRHADTGLKLDNDLSKSTTDSKRQRTKDDGVELIGAGVHVGQQDGAGLEEGEELREARLCERRQELLLALGHLQLQHRVVVDHKTLQTARRCDMRYTVCWDRAVRQDAMTQLALVNQVQNLQPSARVCASALIAQSTIATMSLT